MQEEVEQKTIALSVRTARMTASGTDNFPTATSQGDRCAMTPFYWKSDKHAIEELK